MPRNALVVCAALAAFVPAAASAGFVEGMTAAPVAGSSLTERVWVRTDVSDLPGSMQLFLSDGTLLSDSCWETYRLSNWRMTGEDTLSWDEDGVTIPATIISLDEANLVLELELIGGETVTQSFEVAPVPFVCPDMPR